MGRLLAAGGGPDPPGAERGGFGEQLGISSQRNVKAGTHKIRLEARRERRMRDHGGEIGHHVFGFDLPVEICQMRKQRWLDVWLRCCAVMPERICAPPPAV